MKTASRHPMLSGATVLILSAVALYGCKDFLETASTPQGTLNQLTLANKAGVEGSLIAAYRALDWNNAVGGDWGNSASNWVWGSVTSDDAYKGSEATDQPAINDVEAYQWSTANTDTYLNQKWRGVYEGINRANATLRLLKSVTASSPGEFSAAEAKSIEGEAKFLRAHFHFEAWRMWGNIPYYTEDDTDFREANMTADAAAAEIMKDLDAAIGLLPADGPRNGQKGRVYQWTAKAYKGRLQVYTGNWAGALTTLREVRASGKYALESSYDKVYTGIAAAANGPETIFAYQASSNDGEADGNNASYGERLNYPHSGSPFGCCGFHQPSQNFVNFFSVDANGLPLALSDANWNARDDNLTAAASAAMPLDPRLDWTVGRDGVPFKDWGPHATGWIRSQAYGGPYSSKKHVYEDASNAESNVGWVPTQLSSVNVHLYRYADLLLMLAEAEVEAGTLDNARTIVNEIRTRAGQRAQGCGLPPDATRAAALVALYPTCAGQTAIAVPLNDPSIKWATYRVGLYPAGSAAFASKEAARTAVRYERRLELGLEGQRFFDLRRYGGFEQVLNTYVTKEKTRRPHLTSAEVVQARHRYYPIPNTQVELSKVGQTPRLTQNPGW